MNKQIQEIHMPEHDSQEPHNPRQAANTPRFGQACTTNQATNLDQEPEHMPAHMHAHQGTHQGARLDARLVNVIEVAGHTYLAIELASSNTTKHFAAASADPAAATPASWLSLIGLIGAVVPCPAISLATPASNATPGAVPSVAPSAMPTVDHDQDRQAWASDIKPPQPMSEPTFNFIAYPDQSLRRAPELDVYVMGPQSNFNPSHAITGLAPAASVPPTIGWTCLAHPEGFLAPAGLIPGISTQGRAFVSDESQFISLAVPREFLQLCSDQSQTPSLAAWADDPQISHALSVLHRFMADACALRNTPAMPRADALASSNAQAQGLAQAYLGAAWPKQAHALGASEPAQGTPQR
jgi:hypothetical protein